MNMQRMLAASLAALLVIVSLASRVAQADVVLSNQSGNVSAQAVAEGGLEEQVDLAIPSDLWGYSLPATKLISNSVPDPNGVYGPAAVTTTLTLQSLTTLPGDGSVNLQGNASAATLVQTTLSPGYGQAYQGAGVVSTDYVQSVTLTSPTYYRFEAFVSAGAMIHNPVTQSWITGSGSGTTIVSSGVLQAGSYTIGGMLGIEVVVSNGSSVTQSESYWYNFQLSQNPIPTSVAVPMVVGIMQDAATSAITGAGLVVGTINTQSSATAAPGLVLSQSPTAGTNVASGSAVNIVVSSGPTQESVPTVVGLTQATASSAITSAGLVVGTVSTQSSSMVPAGSVISQSPTAGTNVASGSAVNIVVSSGPTQESVPTVAGLTQAAASSAITSAGLVVGTVSTQSSSIVPAGSVISQSPTAGTNVASGSAVNIVVSSGPTQESVPTVVGLTQAAASSAITSAGLVVGTVSTQSSSMVPAGSVISQSPTAGTNVASGSAVNIVVSSGAIGGVVGDVNGDGIVNCADVRIVLRAFGARKGHRRYDLRADLNRDGVVNEEDLRIVRHNLTRGVRCRF
jgi:beta-lactam-binding protein with PASTA domain